MSCSRLVYASGFLLLLFAVAVTAQDEATGEPVEEVAPEVAPTDGAPPAEPEDAAPEAEPSEAPLAEPTAAAAAAAEGDVVPSTTAAAAPEEDAAAVTNAADPAPVPAAGGVQITSPDSGNVIVGEVVNMRCINPAGADVKWTISSRGSETVIEDNPPFVISASKVDGETVSFLTVEGIRLEDAGEYSCQSVDDSSDKSTINITVAELISDAEGTTAAPPAAESVAADVSQPTTGSLEVVTDGTTDGRCRGDLCDEKDATTTKDTTDIAELTTAAAALPVETPTGDPCTDYKPVGGTHFTVEKPSGDAPCFGLFDSPSAWIRFHLKEEEDIAEIPMVPIKQDYCGVHFAFHVHLQGKEMPAANETEAAEICSYLKGEVDQPCANNKPVEIHNCNDQFFVYRFPEKLRDEKLCENKGGAEVCLKKPGEMIPIKYRSDIIPVTTVHPATTEAIPDYGLPRLEDLTEEQANGTLTIEYNMPEDVDPRNCTGFWIGIDEEFRQMIANAVNAYLSRPPEPEPTTVGKDFTTRVATTRSTILATTKPTPALTEAEEYIETDVVLETEVEQTEPIFEEPPKGPQASDNIDDDTGKGPSKREANEKVDEDNKVKKEEPTKYTKDDVYYVYDTPTCVSGIVQVAIVVTKIEKESVESKTNRVKRAAPSGQVIPQDQLDKAVSDIDKDTHKENTGLEYVQHYQGEPREPDPKAGAMEGHMSIWDAHMGLFIAVIVLIIICLIVIIIGILCIKCKGQKSKPEKTPLKAEEGKSSTVIENPISDEEITKGEAPMTEAPNPAYTPNGSGQHLTKGDEDNGWIVPLEELSYAERERPEVENTKL